MPVHHGARELVSGALHSVVRAGGRRCAEVALAVVAVVGVGVREVGRESPRGVSVSKALVLRRSVAALHGLLLMIVVHDLLFSRHELGGSWSEVL